MSRGTLFVVLVLAGAVLLLLPEGYTQVFPETFRRTLDFALQLKPFGPVKAYPLALLPGSELELQRQEHGFETNHDPVPLVTSSRYFTHEQWLEMRAMASSQQAM